MTRRTGCLTAGCSIFKRGKGGGGEEGVASLALPCALSAPSEPYLLGTINIRFEISTPCIGAEGPSHLFRSSYFHVPYLSYIQALTLYLLVQARRLFQLAPSIQTQHTTLPHPHRTLRCGAPSITSPLLTPLFPLITSPPPALSRVDLLPTPHLRTISSITILYHLLYCSTPPRPSIKQICKLDTG